MVICVCLIRNLHLSLCARYSDTLEILKVYELFELISPNQFNSCLALSYVPKIYP